MTEPATAEAGQNGGSTDGLPQPAAVRGRRSSACSATSAGPARPRPRRRRRQPAWSRKRGPYVRRRDQRPRPGRSCPTPSCTRTRRSRSSTAPPRPKSSPKRRERLGLHALAITDHDGFYGIVRFAEAAESAPAEDRVRRRALARAAGAAERRARPGRRAPARARPRRGGLPPARRRDHARAAAGGEKGRPVYDLDELAAQAGGRLGGADRMPQGRGAPRARRRAGADAAARELDRLVDAVRAGCRARRAHRPRHPARHARRTTLLAGLAAERGLPLLATNNVHYAVPQRARLAAAVAAVRANRGLDELDGWLPAHAGAHLRRAPRWRSASRATRVPSRAR